MLSSVFWRKKKAFCLVCYQFAISTVENDVSINQFAISTVEKDVSMNIVFFGSNFVFLILLKLGSWCEIIRGFCDRKQNWRTNWLKIFGFYFGPLETFGVLRNILGSFILIFNIYRSVWFSHSTHFSQKSVSLLR